MADRDYFQQTKFGSEGEWQTPEDAIRDRHDPEIAYHHIVKLAGSTNAGLSGIPEEKVTAAETYAIVDLFRATVQYVEEFGIYMRSQIEQDENFIKLLIQTSGGNLGPYFKACRDEELTEFLDGKDRCDAATFIDEVFGYQKIRDGNIYPKEATGDIPDGRTVEELIQNSEAFIESELQAIATYYLNVKEAYNAVKHGNRVMVNNSSVFAMETDDTDPPVNVTVDDPYISFLCKDSGAESTGDPYILTVPASFLERWSLDIADRVYQLYQQAYQTTTVSIGGEASIDFYKHPDNQNSDDEKYYLIQNPDGTVIVPRDDVPDTLHEFELQDGTTVELVCSLSLSGNTAQLDFAFATEPTEEYPIQVTVELETTERIFRELGTGHFQFSAKPDLLNVNQYIDMIGIWETDDITSIEVNPPGPADPRTVTLDTPFEGIQVPDTHDRDFLEFIRRIELATQTRIPNPPVYPDKHYNIYEEFRDQELDRDTAEEILNELQTAGRDTGNTQLTIEVWNEPWSHVQENEALEPERKEYIWLFQTRVELNVDGEHRPRGDPGEVWMFEPAPSTYSVERAIEKVESTGISGVTELRESEIDPDKEEARIGVKIQFKDLGLWGTFDIVTVAFFTTSDGG